MALNFQIGEISRFFDIPASTLRYWEDKGVLHPEKGMENRYREYTIEDLMTISDVVFYKNLGLQLKEIREMDGSSRSSMESSLLKSSQNWNSSKNCLLAEWRSCAAIYKL